MSKPGHAHDPPLRRGARTARRFASTTWSSPGALDEASARIAGLLAERGVAAGDSVGLILPNGPYFPIVLHGDAGEEELPTGRILKREISLPG